MHQAGRWYYQSWRGWLWRRRHLCLLRYGPPQHCVSLRPAKQPAIASACWSHWLASWCKTLTWHVARLLDCIEGPRLLSTDKPWVRTFRFATKVNLTDLTNLKKKVDRYKATCAIYTMTTSMSRMLFDSLASMGFICQPCLSSCASRKWQLPNCFCWALHFALRCSLGHVRLKASSSSRHQRVLMVAFETTSASTATKST